MSLETATDAGSAVHALFRDQHVGLVRLASLLVGDPGRAEEIVQDAFIDVYHSWERIRDRDKLPAYVRRAVVSRSRSELRHLRVVSKHALKIVLDAPSAEATTIELLERESLLSTLQRLPRRQREVLVLRYYVELSEADIASTLGISRGSVKSHSSRGLRAMRRLLGEVN